VPNWPILLAWDLDDKDHPAAELPVLHPDVRLDVGALVPLPVNAQDAQSVRNDVVARVGEQQAGPAFPLRNASQSVV